jgi:RNA-directed DNA polymerase
MQAVFVTTRGATCKRLWALDADLAAAFDRIDHSHLLDQLGMFPARKRVGQWLKAGVLDKGRFAPTERGSPQGGVISPVLMNVALHGMEEAAGVRYITTGSNAGTARPGSPVLIRYADDALALCHSREQAQQVQARLAAWLQPRGLVFNQDKTRVVHLDDGVDFLGFNVRRYRGKLLIKPSKAAVKRIRARLTTEMKALRGHNAQMVLIRLNPVIRGWSAYYRHCVSSKVFDALDGHVWKLTYKWANWTHPHKGKRWIVRRYFGRFVHTRRDRWVFGDRDSGAYLLRFAWTKITRHTLVKGWASPDDPALASYWAARRRRGTPPLDPPRLRLLQRQPGTLPALRATAPARRPRTTTPQRVGTVDHSRPRSDPPPGDHHRRAARDPRRTRRVQPYPQPLPTPPARRRPQWTSTSADLTQCTPLGLPEPVARKAGTAGSEGTAAQQCAAVRARR